MFSALSDDDASASIRANMIVRGVAAKLLGLGEEALSALIEKRLKEKARRL